MASGTSLQDILDFLAHAGDRGLMPAATAQALAVATRNVFAVLDVHERADVPVDDLDAVIKRFTNKRARDFTPASLKEYGRRVQRAVSLYQQWQDDPANFSVATRATSSAARRASSSSRVSTVDRAPSVAAGSVMEAAPPTVASPYAISRSGTGFQTAFPVRAGHLVMVSNIPHDLTKAEADRLGDFVRLLATVDEG